MMKNNISKEKKNDMLFIIFIVDQEHFVLYCNFNNHFFVKRQIKEIHFLFISVEWKIEYESFNFPSTT